MRGNAEKAAYELYEYVTPKVCSDRIANWLRMPNAKNTKQGKLSINFTFCGRHTEIINKNIVLYRLNCLCNSGIFLLFSPNSRNQYFLVGLSPKTWPGQAAHCLLNCCYYSLSIFANVSGCCVGGKLCEMELVWSWFSVCACVRGLGAGSDPKLCPARPAGVSFVLTVCCGSRK